MTRVSVLLPVLNGAATIEKALCSLTAQTMGDFEALVVDDGSTDATREIVAASAQKDQRIRLIALDRNYGVSHARNVALDNAQGKWITLLDADDWIDPARLQILLDTAEKLDVDMVFDNMKLIGAASGRLEFTSDFGAGVYPKSVGPRELFMHDTPYARLAMGYAQPLVRTAFLRAKAIRYNEAYGLGEDFVFMAEILLHGGKAYAIAGATYNYCYTLPSAFTDSEKASKSNRGYAQVLQASDALLAHFGDAIAPDVRAAIVRRRDLFATLLELRAIKGFALRGQFAEALRGIVRCPRVIPFALRMAAFRLMRVVSLLLPFTLE